MKEIKLPEFDDSWAEVELYRWQFGELPPQDNTCKELSMSEGLRGMAKAIELGCKAGDPTLMPPPFNVVEVLNYVARKLEKP